MKYIRVLALAAITAEASAQSLSRQVLSTFIFTTYGDRTPLAIENTTPQLTPLGAQQMYNAGATFRSHYISPLNLDGEDGDDLYSAIRGISQYHLDPDQITVLSRDEQYISAGAMAFMQGLYPGLEQLNNYTFIVGQSGLADGTNVVSPLQGYQYPRMQVASDMDLNHIWLDGSANCPYYTKSGASYYSSKTYETTQADTADFYQALVPGILQGTMPEEDIGYFDAWTVYDYLQYMNTHNRSVAEALAPEDLTRAEILATDWVFALNANTSSSGAKPNDQVGVIAGKTIASRVLQAFQNQISSQGTEDKMTLLFGSFEPIIAFTALAGLNVEQHTEFLNLPPQGASMVFELFSLGGSDFGTYPDSSNLYVRFLYQNGTTNSSTLVPYPLFDHSPSVTDLSLSDFINNMNSIAIPSVAAWCNTCDSYSIFCPAFSEASNGGSPLSRGSSNNNSKLSPAIAGVIGAAVAIAVLILLFLILFFLLGCRVQRVPRGRRSELGGFKGAEKLASDRDLTIPKGANGQAEVVVAETDEPMSPGPRGHERTGSWELREQQQQQQQQKKKDLGFAGLTQPGKAMQRRPSYEDDDDEITVNPFSRAVKPDERV